MTSQIIELNDKSRIDEIASLISGTKITETAKKVALVPNAGPAAILFFHIMLVRCQFSDLNQF